MSRRPGASEIPLPLGWPLRVRSAVVNAVSLAQVSLTATRAWAANSYNARLRLRAENDRLLQEIGLLREELRIKDARMQRIPPQRRPHYPPIERLAILELRAARGWSMAQTAERLLVTPLTIASWRNRLDDEGPDALVQVREPVNRFPDFVGYLVRRLRVLCPTMGKRRIARLLCRAGLHLGATTVRRMLQPPTRPQPSPSRRQAARVVTAREPSHVWHADLTTVPTTLGFWIPWLPNSLPPVWPFCWWVALVVDHFSRKLVAFEVYLREPASKDLRLLLERAIREAGKNPAHIITDQGVQFTATAFCRWCRRKGIRQRFGAVGKYGSISIVERFIRSMKNECTRRLLVPYRRDNFRRELSLYAGWYNDERPHEALGCRTPDEVYSGRRPACRLSRFEPRAKWPRGSGCAAPRVPVRGRPGVQLGLAVAFADGRKHLPVVSVRRAA